MATSYGPSAGSVEYGLGWRASLMEADPNGSIAMHAPEPRPGHLGHAPGQDVRGAVIVGDLGARLGGQLAGCGALEHPSSARALGQTDDAMGKEQPVLVLEVGFDKGRHPRGDGVLNPAHRFGEVPVRPRPASKQQLERALPVRHELVV